MATLDGDDGRYGFAWGPVIVERTAHIDGRGYVVTVRTPGSYEPSVQVYVSEKGRVMRVYPRGKVEVDVRP